MDMHYISLQFVDVILHSVVDTRGVQDHVAYKRLHELHAQVKGRGLLELTDIQSTINIDNTNHVNRNILITKT